MLFSRVERRKIITFQHQRQQYQSRSFELGALTSNNALRARVLVGVDLEIGCAYA